MTEAQKKSTVIFVAAVVLLGVGSAAAQRASPVRDEGERSTMYLRLDNDAFADSDRGYTNGIQVGFTSPTVESFEDPRLGPRLRSLNRRFAWLQPLSGLVVQIDELLAADAPTVSDGDALLEQARMLLRPDENGEGFQRRYHRAIQDVPDVLIAHVALGKHLI